MQETASISRRGWKPEGENHGIELAADQSFVS